MENTVSAMTGEMLAKLARLVKYNSERTAPEEGMPFGRGCAAVLAEGLRIAEEILKPYTERVLLLPPAKGLTGLGGSCTTAAAMQAGREMHGEAVEGITVSLETLKKQLALLSGLPMEVRMRVPGLPPGRAGIMPHGLCILIAALTLLKMDRFTVSGKTNLDGYLLELPE